MKLDRVLLIHKKSLYQLYVKEHHHRPVQRALARRDPIALRLLRAHSTQQAALAHVKQTLQRLGLEVVVRWRADMRTAAGFDLIISCGGDGTLLDASHCILGSTPLLGVNSDPVTSVGALCAGTADQLEALLTALAQDRLRPRPITRLRVRLGGKTVLGPCLNDVLFAHASPAVLTKFELAVLPARKVRAGRLPARRAALPLQRSSGLWIATACGSTAAMRSAGGAVLPRGSRRLQYLVREPYTPPGEPRPRGIVRGFVQPGEVLALVSRVRRGMLWADGPYRKVELPYGEPVILDEEPAPLRLVPPPRRPLER